MAGVEFGPEIGDSVYTVKANAAFKKADKNGDGVLDAEELETLNSVFGDGAFKAGITYDEFISQVPKIVEERPDVAEKLAKIPDQKEKQIKSASIK